MKRQIMDNRMTAIVVLKFFSNWPRVFSVQTGGSFFKSLAFELIPWRAEVWLSPKTNCIKLQWNMIIIQKSGRTKNSICCTIILDLYTELSLETFQIIYIYDIIRTNVQIGRFSHSWNPFFLLFCQNNNCLRWSR